MEGQPKEENSSPTWEHRSPSLLPHKGLRQRHTSHTTPPLSLKFNLPLCSPRSRYFWMLSTMTQCILPYLASLGEWHLAVNWFRVSAQPKNCLEQKRRKRKEAQRGSKTADQRLRNWMWTPDMGNLHLVCFLLHHFCFLPPSIWLIDVDYTFSSTKRITCCAGRGPLCLVWPLTLILSTWSHNHIFQTSAQDCTVSQSTIFS